MLILNTFSFQKKILSKLSNSLPKLALEDGAKTAVFRKFCKTFGNIYMTEFTIKEVTVFRGVTFLNEALPQI